MLRRGFKSQSERRAVELRRALGLSSIAPLSAFDLAAHLGVTIWSAADVTGWSAGDRDHLFRIAKDEWSAFVIRERNTYLIIYNPAHSKPRINSDLMHELSHIVLGHELAYSKQTADGYLLNGNYDQSQEDEANWLGGTLLLPRPALIWMRSRGMAENRASEYFGVSAAMLQWRIRMTGVDYQIRRLG